MNHNHASAIFRSTSSRLVAAMLIIILATRASGGWASGANPTAFSPAGSATTSSATGAFTLNWQQDSATEGASRINNEAYFCGGFSYMTCSGGGGGWRGTSGSNDGTPFLQETLQLNGQKYFHVIVGDYTKDSMAQEVFIQVSSGNNSNDGITFSDSLCNNCSQSRNFDAGDALNSNSGYNGNGGGNPEHVMMQQAVSGVGYQSQFLKDSFTQKPLITSTVTTADMISTVILDMRGRDYTQLTPIDLSNVTISQTMLGPNSFGTAGDFEIHAQGQNVHVTAGGFTYTPTPDSARSGGGGGSYTYFEGTGFNPLNFNYAAFCDPTQNSNATASGGGGGGFGGFGSGGGAACGGSSTGR